MQTPPHKRDAPKIEQTAGAAAEPGESGQSGRLALLTPREHELFLLLLEGYTLKEAADRLSVKYSTANTHMTGVYKKLNVNSRAELIIRYRDTGQKPTERGGHFHPAVH
jgi:DNA-binding CsgD family transcriptional regulator